jgi:O-antigen ligase
MTHFKWLQIALLILLPLSLTFIYLSGGNFLIGAITCACLITGCFCSLALDKPELGILSILIASAFTDRQALYLSHSFYLIYFIVIICFVHYFSSHATNRKFFWFFAIWVCSYHILVLVVHPYSVPGGWILFYFSNLAIFLWCILIRWDMRKIMNIVVPYLIYLIAYGFIEKLAFDPMRVGGPTTHATNYAVILTFLWTMWFIGAYLNKKHSLFVLALASLIVLFAVFLSGTKMGLLGMLTGLFGALASKAWIYNLNKSLTQKLLYTIGISLAIMLSIYVIWIFLPNNTFLIKSWNTLLSGSLDRSSMGRLMAWAAALDSFSKNTIWGVGPGNFIQVYTAEFIAKMPLLEVSNIPKLKHAHSIGLNVLAENGLSGVIMLSVVIVICWLQLLKFLLNNPRNPLGYTLLFGGIIIFCLPMVDMIPSPGWDSWYYGILASLGFHNYIKPSEPKNQFNIKTVS